MLKALTPRLQTTRRDAPSRFASRLSQIERICYHVADAPSLRQAERNGSDRSVDREPQGRLPT